MFLDYRINKIKLAELDNNEEELYKEDNATYLVNVQSFKQKSGLIGELSKNFRASI